MATLGEFAGLESRTMTETVKRFPRKNLVLADLFPLRPSATKSVYWDIVSGTRRLGKFTAPGAESHIDKLTPRTRVNTEVLYIGEKKVIDQNTKNFIDGIGKLDSAYGNQLIVDELEELDRIVENTKEWMRAEAITKGQIDVQQIDPAIRLKVDYGMDADHKATASTLWSNTSSAKPLNDILNWKKLISRDAWGNATSAYCSYQGMIYLVENSAVQTLLQYTVGNQLAENGFITRLGGLNIATYDISYVNEAGTTCYFIPDNKFIVLDKESLGKAFTGPQDVPEGDGVRTVVGKVSYSWATKDPVDTWIKVSDSYMPAIQNPDLLVIGTIA